MRNALLSLLALLLCSLPCAVQSEGPHDDVPIYEGTWNVRLGDGHAARLVVQDWQGTWQETGARQPAASSPCRGKPLPVTVHHSNTAEFEFTAWGSTVSATCADIAVSLKPLDARTLEGTTGAGVRITMTRAANR